MLLLYTVDILAPQVMEFLPIVLLDSVKIIVKVGVSRHGDFVLFMGGIPLYYSANAR